jgi:hypothetical protein
MDCVNPSAYFNTIDMCDDKDCLSAEFTRDDLNEPHLPSHRTFKSRKLLLIRDIGLAFMTVRDAIERGDKAITDALASYKEGNKEEADSQTSEGHQGGRNELSTESGEKEGLGLPSSQIPEVHDGAKTGLNCTSNDFTSKYANTVFGELIRAHDPDATTSQDRNADRNDHESKVVETSWREGVNDSSSVLVSTGDSNHQKEEQNSGEVEEIVSEKGVDDPSNTKPQVNGDLATTRKSETLNNGELAGYDKEPRPEDDTKSEGSGSSEHSESQHSSSSKTTAPPTNRCYCCDEKLESPCWYCIDCSSESYCRALSMTSADRIRKTLP